MPTLDWIGKKAVLNHHREVPYHLLKCDKALSVGDPGSGNLLVQGDNLLALKALLPYYAGKVKCIYIDPPYNTGNENWVYNDAVNSPEIRKWLGKVVGAEAEDLSRHDKWLCMMYPRLSILRQLLRPDGAIFVSIDDTEYHNLRMLMNEVFGPMNWVCTLIWKRRQTPDSRNLNGVSADHEYVLCYSRGDLIRFKGQSKDLTKYKNPDNDPLGPWMSDNLTGLANAQERPNLHYEIIDPVTRRHYPPHPSRGWIYGQERMNQLIADGKILWPKSATGRPRLKRFVTDMKSETTGLSTLLDAPANVAGTKELSSFLGTKVFAFPKPTGLVKLLIQQVTDENSLILDSFAGSGTTGHAVLAQNKADGGSRQFILVEMEEAICQAVTAQRLSRVIEGHDGMPALSGGFRYCRLGPTIFDEAGNVRAYVTFGELAAHVYLAETGEPLPKRNGGKSPLLGVHKGKAICLLFNGILGDRSAGGGNVLTSAVLKSLPAHDGPRVIFGEGCRLGAARLKRERIAFKQIPYGIKVS
ncbi:MAG: site-specific DNA-methyltransferase [Planctomycetia bacterium]|nr:site-specific DNA-methyltransferase [Planctomycetia bacterium]